LSYKKLRNIAILFIVAFFIQIRYSPKARRWSKSMGQAALFTMTSMGILGTLGALLIKYKIEKNSKN
jgi:uncharacterized BrkB/YihY/UPF0761 family membrane protein